MKPDRSTEMAPEAPGTVERAPQDGQRTCETVGEAQGEAKRTAECEAMIKRLRRLEGQVRGLQKMVEEEADCEQILMQFAAMRQAFESAGVAVVTSAIRDCMEQKAGGKIPEAALDEAVRLWQRYAVYLK